MFESPVLNVAAIIFGIATLIFIIVMFGPTKK
jgi:hypothetical protein